MRAACKLAAQVLQMAGKMVKVRCTLHIRFIVKLAQGPISPWGQQ